MKKIREFWEDTRGDAVVEATILFPIMVMICAALVLLSIYLLPFRLSVANARPIDSDVDLFTRGHNKRQEP